MSGNVTLISVQNMSEQQLTDRLIKENVGRGIPGKKYVGIIFDAQMISEAITDPHLRVAPFQEKYYSKVGQARV